ncbi:hypothetical protein PR202_ga28815 [Eleusine coracana subsp. coracana]|uniref:Uncharacterized protein n=1 Tax=Eleusine coracana subsp. coracana TaxID=191504 RepID=A0AAV5DJH7_ELECO|nr:hypothetical protein QOZ80_7AG0581590 [Eleusine coracana subsp. coracana]GJN10698.1 hypothetical protein PR202_ga28815 [Eleusine coracana subsp. coracana]
MAMASSNILLLLVFAVAVLSVLASGAQPPQPRRIEADVVVMGFVPCNNGTSMRTGSAPGFPNAVVQLQCPDGGVAANATTDGRGWFRIALNTTATLSSVASGCDLAVATPLASCNAALPATGTLRSGLRLLVSMVFFPRGFSYVSPSSSLD